MELPTGESKSNRRRAFGVAFLALLGAGCANGPPTVRRDMGDQPTIGRNNGTAPRGRTIPPAGLGVDLVKGEPEAKGDASVALAKGL
jgi:hypothetical protein